MKEPLTRDRILREAVSFADEQGLQALSMRKLAPRLGVETMTPYYHVRNKGEILDGMVDIVLAELEPPSTESGWRAILESNARGMREMFNRHPWAISLLDSRSQPGPGHLAHLDALIGALRADGFSIAMCGHALAVVDSFVRGFVLQEQALPSQEGDMTTATENIMDQEAMTAGEFPHLAAMATELVLRPGYAFANEFEYGLQLILDGIDRRSSEPGRP